jgi:hypothetical protein
MMETVIIRVVNGSTAETVAHALEDFRGELVSITIKKVVPKKPKAEKEGQHVSSL